MKSLLILLVLTISYYLTSAQIISDNGTTIIITNNSSNTNNNQGPQDFNNITSPQVDNNPFILGLINYGSQVVLGHVLDSQLIGFNYNYGNYSKIYDVSAHSDNGVNLTADVQIKLYYAIVHAIFTVEFNASNDFYKLLSYSYEWQNYTLSSPSGYNISYDESQDLYEVVTFSGFDQTLTYQNQDLPDQTTSYSGEDFLQKFANWTSLNTSDIYDNQTIQYSFNAALRGLRSRSYNSLLDYNYTELNVSVIQSIDTYSVQDSADYFRYDFEFNTESQSGRVVCVVTCPLYNYIYPPYWPPYYPIDPLNVAADGAIVSTAGSESIGANAAMASGAPTVANAATASGAPTVANAATASGATTVSSVAASNAEMADKASAAKADRITQSNDTSGGVASDGNGSAGPPIVIDTPNGPAYYNNYNCLYGTLNYFYFVEIQDTD